MTEEQIEKEAHEYAIGRPEHIHTGDYSFTKQDWKAGYHFRDKEVEELKAEIKKYVDFLHGRTDRIEVSHE